MGADAKKVIHLQGPWKGIMEYPHECGDGQVQDCLNVEFDGNWITQRAGRTKFAIRHVARPTSAINQSKITGSLVTTEVGSTLTDGDTSTVLVGAQASFGGVVSRLYIGSPWPFQSIVATVGNVVNHATTPLHPQYVNRSGYTDLAGVVDGTMVASAPFAKSGTISWTQAGDWIPGAPGFETDTNFNQSLYWMRIDSGALDSTWKLAEVRINFAASTINGLYHFTLKNNSTRLIVGMDDPGVSGASPRSPQARIAWYDEASDEYIPILIPVGANQTASDAYYSFVAVNGYLLFTNGVGPILRYNTALGVETCAILEAALGLDSTSRSYLPSAPRGRYLAYFQGRLYVAGNPASPYTVQFSEVDGADNIIPSDGSAPVGGPNVWPGGNDFDINSSASDQITGLVETYDRRLVIFGKQSVQIFDGGELLRAESRVGCVAPRSIVSIGQEIYFLSALGVHVFTGASATHISYPIQPTLDKIIHKGAIENVVGVNVPGKHQYRLAIPTPMHYQNRMCLVYNYQRKAWSKWAGLPSWYSEPTRSSGQEMNISAATVAALGTEDELLITGDYAGNLWAEDRGIRDGAQFPLAFVAFRVVGDDDESVKAWRTWRGSVVMDGAYYNASVAIDGAQFYGRAGADDASPAPADATKLASLPGTLSNGTGQPDWGGGATWPVQVASYGPNRRTSEIKFSVGRTGRQLQPILWVNGLDNAQGPDDGRLAVRGLDIEFRPRTGRR